MVAGKRNEWCGVGCARLVEEALPVAVGVVHHIQGGAGVAADKVRDGDLQDSEVGQKRE